MVSTDQFLTAFTLSATSQRTITLDSLRGKATVLYFYPKDNTPGCSQEGQDFSEHFSRFTTLGVQIFGISRDSLKKHDNFKAKHHFPFDLISDPDEILCRQFDVIKLKKLYGREYLGIVRSTFLLDADGALIESWRNVRVKGHVETVLATCIDLFGNAS